MDGKDYRRKKAPVKGLVMLLVRLLLFEVVCDVREAFDLANRGEG